MVKFRIKIINLHSSNRSFSGLSIYSIKGKVIKINWFEKFHLKWCVLSLEQNDIIVFGKLCDNHMDRFPWAKYVGQIWRPKNWDVLRKVRYPGHIVLDKRISVEDTKIKAITDWPITKDKHEFWSFLGQWIYYRRLVLRFIDIAKPLTKLTEEKSTFVSNQECQAAFELLKR